MTVVISILSLILISGLHLLGKTGSYARKSATDRLIAMVERARLQAITSRSMTLIAIAEPVDLAISQPQAQIGIFKVTEWKPDAKSVSGELLQRWEPLESGIVLATGEMAGIRNIIDEPKIELIDQRGGNENPINAWVIAFTPRGGLHWPTGSDPMLLRLAEGSYRGANRKAAINVYGDDRSVAENRLHIGRVNARAYRID